MAQPAVRLGFFKLNVPEMEPALAFWQEAFGFQIAMSFDESEFTEHVLALPGQEQGPQLMLVCPRHGRELAMGTAHGPVGLVCEDIVDTHTRAVAHGAEAVAGPFAVAGVQVAVLRSPQGHEIELVQLPGGSN